jgi:TIR domain
VCSLPSATTIQLRPRLRVSDCSRQRYMVYVQSRAAGVAMYLAEHDITPGQRLSDKVTQAIETCNVVLVLLSKNSLTSVFVQQEIGIAQRAGKLVIPLLMDDVEVAKTSVY